jgi:hypothetical protein
MPFSAICNQSGARAGRLQLGNCAETVLWLRELPGLHCLECTKKKLTKAAPQGCQVQGRPFAGHEPWTQMLVASPGRDPCLASNAWHIFRVGALVRKLVSYAGHILMAQAPDLRLGLVVTAAWAGHAVGPPRQLSLRPEFAAPRALHRRLKLALRKFPPRARALKICAAPIRLPEAYGQSWHP